METIKQFGPPFLIVALPLSLLALDVHAPGTVPRPVSVAIGLVMFLWWVERMSSAIDQVFHKR